MARRLTAPVAEAPDAGVRQNARSDRQTPLAVGSHRACEANFRIRCVGNAFKKVIVKKPIDDVGCRGAQRGARKHAPIQTKRLVFVVVILARVYYIEN